MTGTNDTSGEIWPGLHFSPGALAKDAREAVEQLNASDICTGYTDTDAHGHPVVWHDGPQTCPVHEVMPSIIWNAR